MESGTANLVKDTSLSSPVPTPVLMALLGSFLRPVLLHLATDTEAIEPPASRFDTGVAMQDRISLSPKMATLRCHHTREEFSVLVIVSDFSLVSQKALCPPKTSDHACF